MTGRLKQLLWVLPLAIAGLVAVLGWWGNELLRDTIHNELRAQLAATLNANVTALGIWSTNQTRLAMSLAEDPALRTVATRILQSPPPAARRNFQPSPDLAAFASDFRPKLAELGYEIAELVNPDFRVVANSARPQWPGNQLVSDAHTNKFADLFLFGEPVIITPFKPEMLMQRRGGRNATGQSRTNDLRRLNRPASVNGGRPRRGDISLMQVAAPVRDPANKIIGALALIINPDQEFSRILSVAHLGASGETYAFDQTGLLISRSRFDLQLKQLGLLDTTNVSSALNLRLHDPGGDLTKGFQPTNELTARPLIRLVSDAVDGEEEVLLFPTRDYRGVQVVGASCWLPDFGFGVATQMDADEAYRPLRVLQMIFVVLILFLLLFATGLFIFTFANLNWRRRLSEAELKLKQLGQYTLEEKIGEGGMGVVYRARHALLRRDTAVKLLLPDRADAASIARFEKEVCLTCQLTHPNTIQVYDYGHTPDGIFYYAMEFLHGLNLHDLVARYGPQPEGRVIHILGQICDSLAEAHALGLIHRDIKPANIFLCHRGGVADCVKVLDFGLVREFRDDQPGLPAAPGDNVIEGTPWFTPPEAITGAAPLDPRSDLYALGALGYFLLTGHYIFDADSIAEVHSKQLNSVPIPPRQRTTQPISSALEELLLQCLEKNAAARPQSADELRQQLLAGPAVSEWPVSARVAWWEAYEQQPVVSAIAPVAAFSPPMVTVRIDLADRMAKDL